MSDVVKSSSPIRRIRWPVVPSNTPKNPLCIMWDREREWETVSETWRIVGWWDWVGDPARQMIRSKVIYYVGGDIISSRRSMRSYCLTFVETKKKEKGWKRKREKRKKGSILVQSLVSVLLIVDGECMCEVQWEFLFFFYFPLIVFQKTRRGEQRHNEYLGYLQQQRLQIARPVFL